MNPRPKPSRTLAQVRATRKREDDRRASAMRAKVWVRDGHQCRCCARWVFKTSIGEFARGEVHHLRGRRVAPEHKFNPDRCVLLCLSCHVLITNKQIAVTGTTAADVSFRRVR